MIVPPILPMPTVADALASPRARRSVAVLIAAALSFGVAPPASTQPASTTTSLPPATPPVSASTAHPYAVHVAEASRRFGIPEAWIWSVMRVESAGDPTATSHAGAMGLMQVMPGTYAELRSRYALGPDAYDLRDNILAGAAYLREMHDRYGATGMLAAYNAGPGRWEDHLARGRPLPAETVAYMARLGATVGGSAAPSPAAVVQVDRFAWRRASLFVVLDDPAPTNGSDAAQSQAGRVADAAPTSPAVVPTDTMAQAEPDASGTLFAVRRPQ